MTRDQVVQHFKELELEYNSITARIRALVYSGLFTDGPDTRLTTKGRPAGVLRIVKDADFDELYQEPPPGSGRCNPRERSFLDATVQIVGEQASGALTMHDAQQLLWDAAQTLREGD